MRLVFEDQKRVLRQPPHPAEQELALAADELRPPGQVRVEALDAPVVQGQHVVLARFDQEEPLEVMQLLGLLGGEVVRLGPVVGAVQLPDVVVDRRAPRPSTHGVLCRVTAVQPWW